MTSDRVIRLSRSCSLAFVISSWISSAGVPCPSRIGSRMKSLPPAFNFSESIRIFSLRSRLSMWCSTKCTTTTSYALSSITSEVMSPSLKSTFRYFLSRFRIGSIHTEEISTHVRCPSRAIAAALCAARFGRSRTHSQGPTRSRPIRSCLRSSYNGEL